MVETFYKHYHIKNVDYYYPASYVGHNDKLTSGLKYPCTVTKTTVGETTTTCYEWINDGPEACVPPKCDGAGQGIGEPCRDRLDCGFKQDAFAHDEGGASWKANQIRMSEYAKPANGEDGSLYIQVYKKTTTPHQCEEFELTVTTE